MPALGNCGVLNGVFQPEQAIFLLNQLRVRVALMVAKMAGQIAHGLLHCSGKEGNIPHKPQHFRLELLAKP